MIRVLIILCLVFPAFAQVGLRSPAFVSQLQRPAAGGGGPSYLINENFEGTGLPTGWAESGGSPDWDYGTPINGSQSMRINSVGPQGYYLFATQSEVWMKFRFRVRTSLATSYFLILSDSGVAVQLRVAVLATGELYVLDSSGTVSDQTVDQIIPDTDYYCWIHYKKGTGANAQGSVAFNTTDSEPTSGNKFAAWADDGQSTADVVYLQLVLSHALDIVYDDVQLAAEDL